MWFILPFRGIGIIIVLALLAPGVAFFAGTIVGVLIAALLCGYAVLWISDWWERLLDHWYALLFLWREA